LVLGSRLPRAIFTLGPSSFTFVTVRCHAIASYLKLVILYDAKTTQCVYWIPFWTDSDDTKKCWLAISC
jgi:hypothetical protein